LSWADDRHEAVVKLLVERDNVEADSKENHGQTPLSRAAADGHEAVVKALLARDDVGLSFKDNYGRKPMLLVVRNRHGAVVKLLAEYAVSSRVLEEVSGQQFLLKLPGMAYHSKMYRTLYCDSPLSFLYRTDLAGVELTWC
jgi:hypothetical protein